MTTYKVLSLDVWGHGSHECSDHDCPCMVVVSEEGEQAQIHDDDTCLCGYEINNWFSCGTIEVPEGADDAALLEILIEEGHLNETARTLAEVDDCNGMGESLTIQEKKTGFPVLQLEEIGA